VKFFGQALPTRAALAARNLRALSYYAIGDYPHAAEDLRAAIAMIHGSERRSLAANGTSAARLELALGNVHRKAGDAAAARDAYMRALGEDVSLAAAHVALADLALVGGDATTAMTEYGAAADIHPNDGGIHARYGDALRVAGDLAGAAEQYRKAIELEPWYFLPYLNLGIVLDKLQQRDDATAAYTQFLARAPRAMTAQIAAVQKRVGAPNEGGSR
jgi:Tfp pilus assembly protein PilF